MLCVTSLKAAHSAGSSSQSDKGTRGSKASNRQITKTICHSDPNKGACIDWSGQLPGGPQSVRIDAKRGDRFLQADFTGLIPPQAG